MLVRENDYVIAEYNKMITDLFAVTIRADGTLISVDCGIAPEGKKGA